jgi:hypothetical protein
MEECENLGRIYLNYLENPRNLMKIYSSHISQHKILREIRNIPFDEPGLLTYEEAKELIFAIERTHINGGKFDPLYDDAFYMAAAVVALLFSMDAVVRGRLQTDLLGILGRRSFSEPVKELFYLICIHPTIDDAEKYSKSKEVQVKMITGSTKSK